MEALYRIIALSSVLAMAMPTVSAQVGEESVTLRGDVSNLDIVRVFLISQADAGFDGLAGKYASVDANALAELQARSKTLKQSVIRNGEILDRKLCNEGAVILDSKQGFDVLYIESFRELDRANNAATARALDGLPAAAYKFLVDELASISFVRSGSPVQSGPPNAERAVLLSCGRLGK